MHSITKAETYSLRQAKWNSPPRNCTAELSDGDRKNTKLKQKMLKVRIRCDQRDRKPVKLLDRTASAGFFLATEKKRSMDRTTPWMAPNTTNVQFAPCQRPPRSVLKLMCQRRQNS